jgi:amidase
MKAVIDMAEALCKKYEGILSAKGIDALFLPRSANPLPNLDANTLDYLGDQVGGTEVNEMGLPAITIPAGVLPDGRPIAVDFVGRAKFTEAEILAFAYDFEQESQLRCTPSLGSLHRS